MADQQQRLDRLCDELTTLVRRLTTLVNEFEQQRTLVEMFQTADAPARLH